MSRKTASILLPALAATLVLVLSILLLPAAGTTADSLHKPEAQEPTGDLQLIKVAMGHSEVEPGGLMTYTVTALWTGTADATGVRLTDTLPAQVTLESSNPAPTARDGRQLVYDIGDIPTTMPASAIQLVARVKSDVTLGTVFTNTATLSGDVQDLNPSNNTASVASTVRPPRPNLWVFKFGLLEELEQQGGPISVAEKGTPFNFTIFYWNSSSAPASDVVLTDTLPAGVDFVSANPTPSVTDGPIVWDLGDVAGLGFGKIKLTVRPTVTGTFLINKADIATPDEEQEVQISNHSQYPFSVVTLVPPRITHPRPPEDGDGLIVGPQPRFEGLAHAGTDVILYEGAQAYYGWATADVTPVLTTTAGTNRVFSGTLETPLTNGDHYIYARAISGTDASDLSWPLHLVVSDTLPVDPEGVGIETGGQDYSPGGLGGGVGGVPGEPVTVTVSACCPPAGPLFATLHIVEKESGETLPPLDPVETVRDNGCATYTFVFNPPFVYGSYEYEMTLHYVCGGAPVEVPIVVILIDPAGYVYDQAKADRTYKWPDKPNSESLIVNAEVTCTVRTGQETWETWDAGTYDQYNPQVTDQTTEDGVSDPGYYAFFVPTGEYKVIATAPGCVDYESPVLTVIDEPVYHNVAMRCTQSTTFEGYDIFLPLVVRN